MSEREIKVAAIRILHNGSELSLDHLSRVESITIEDEINVPTLFTIQFSMKDLFKGVWIGWELDLFKLGDEIKITIGHDGPEELVTGEITDIEPSLCEKAVLTLRGFDRMHRLRFGRYRRSFTDMTDSDIISQLVKDAGLSASVETTSTTYPYVFQNNTTNYQFILHRISRLGYEMQVKNKEFILRPSKEGETPVATLDYGGVLEAFSARLRALTEGSSVEVRGWDIKNKKEITGEAKKGSENSTMDTQATGFALTTETLGESAVAIIDEQVIDDANAKEVASGAYNLLLKKSVTGEGETTGNPAIRAGTTIKLDSLGKRFSGKYYVVSSKHIYTVNTGYKTKFFVQRVGL